MTSKHAPLQTRFRDLIGTQADRYLGWRLDIAEGERTLPSIPFVTAN
jgi:hypothetical protein